MVNVTVELSRSAIVEVGQAVPDEGLGEHIMNTYFAHVVVKNKRAIRTVELVVRHSLTSTN